MICYFYGWTFIKPRCNAGARSIQPKFRPVRPGKVIHLERWMSFFETFPVGPKRSIDFRKFWLNGSRPRSTFAGNSALFPSDDIDLAMCPFRDFGGKQFHLFDVMWPRSNQWERALLGRNFQLYNNWHYSGAAWVRKSAYLCIQEILVLTKSSVRTSTLYSCSWGEILHLKHPAREIEWPPGL